MNNQPCLLKRLSLRGEQNLIKFDASIDLEGILESPYS